MTINKDATIAPIMPPQGVLELDLVEGMSGVVLTTAFEASGIDEVGVLEVEGMNKEGPAEDESDEGLEAEDLEGDTYELDL